MQSYVKRVYILTHFTMLPGSSFMIYPDCNLVGNKEKETDGTEYLIGVQLYIFNSF